MLFVSKEPLETNTQSDDIPDSRPFVRPKRASEDELPAVIEQLDIPDSRPFVREERASEDELSTVIDKLDIHDSRPFVRPKRASEDELSAVIDQLATSARIVTAIALQNGLIDGSIPSDEAFAELMNTGPVGFAELEKFKQKNVDGLIGKLKGLQLTGSKLAKDLEEMITVLDLWKKRYSEIGDLNDFQLAKEYFGKVQSFQSVTLDTQLFVNLSTSIKDLLFLLEKSMKMPVNNPAECTSIFTFLSSKNNDMENFLKNFDGWITTLAKLKSLANKSFALDWPQSKFVRLLKVFIAHQRSVFVVGDSEQTEVVQMINAVSGSLSGSDASVADLSNMAHFVTFRALANPVASRNFTSGFASGHVSLKKVSADARTSIKSLTSRLDQKTLEDGLKPLNTMGDKTDKLEMSWKSLSQSDSVSAAQKVQAMSGRIGSIKTLASTAANSISTVSKYNQRPSVTADFSKNAATMIENVFLFKSMFFGVSQKSALLKQSPLLMDLKGLIEIKNFLPLTPSVDPAEVQKQVAKFQTFKDVQKYNNTLSKLKPLVDDLAGEFAKTDLIRLIKDMSGGLTTVQGFVTHPDAGQFTGYFDNLKKANEIESVAASVKLIQDIRDLQSGPQLVQDISKVAGVIESSLSDLKTLRSVASTIKNNQSPETKLLMQLKSLEKEAKNFGDAMTALTNVKKVLEKAAKLQQFIIDGESVLVEIGKLTDVSLKNELEESWGDFGRTVDEINTLLAVLKKITNQLVVPKASKFADYGSIFTALSKLKDVYFRAEKRKKVLETLAMQNQGLNGLKKLFDELASLDLQFSKFSASLSGMPGTLTNLDLAFAQFSGPKSSSPSPNSSSPNGSTLPPNSQNPSVVAAALLTTTTTSSSTYLIWIGAAGVGVACCGGVGVGIFLLNRRNNKAKQAEVESVEKKDVEPVDKERERLQMEKEKAEAEAAKLKVKNEQLIEEKRDRDELDDLEEAAEKAEAAWRRKRIEEAAKERQAKQMQPVKKVAKVKQMKPAKPVKHRKDFRHMLPKYPNRFSNFLRRYGWVPPKIRKGTIVEDPNFPLHEANKKLRFEELERKHKQKLEKLERENVNNNAFKELNQVKPEYLGKGKTLMGQWYDFHLNNVQDQELRPVRYLGRVRDPNINIVEATQPLKKAPKEDWFDVNVISYPLGGGAFAAQTPMVGNDQGREDTREAFWKFIAKRKCPHVVELIGDNEENVEYFSDKLPMKFGRFEVTVIDVDRKDCVQHRKIQVKDLRLEKNNVWMMQHWKFVGWNENEILTDGKKIAQLIDLHMIIRPSESSSSDPTPYCVISKNGRGRTGTFIGMEYIRQTLIDLRIVLPSLWTILQEMRTKRYGLVSNGWQLYFMLIAGCSYFKDDFPKIKNAFIPGHLDDNFDALLQYNQKDVGQDKEDRIAFEQYKLENRDCDLKELEDQTQEDSQTTCEVNETQEDDAP